MVVCGFPRPAFAGTCFAGSTEKRRGRQTLCRYSVPNARPVAPGPCGAVREPPLRLTRHARLDRASRGWGRGRVRAKGLDSRFHGNDRMRHAPFDRLRVPGVGNWDVCSEPFARSFQASLSSFPREACPRLDQGRESQSPAMCLARAKLVPVVPRTAATPDGHRQTHPVFPKFTG